VKEVKITFRLREDVKKAVEEVAQREGLSLNALVKYLFNRVAQKGRVDIDNPDNFLIKRGNMIDTGRSYPIVNRFKHALRFYGIKDEEIPLLFKEFGIKVNFADIYDNETLVKILNPDVIRTFTKLVDCNVKFFYGREDNLVKCIDDARERISSFTHGFIQAHMRELFPESSEMLKPSIHIIFEGDPYKTLKDDTAEVYCYVVWEIPMRQFESGLVLSKYYVDDSASMWNYYKSRYHIYTLVTYLMSLGWTKLQIKFRYHNSHEPREIMRKFVTGEVPADSVLQGGKEIPYGDRTVVVHAEEGKVEITYPTPAIAKEEEIQSALFGLLEEEKPFKTKETVNTTKLLAEEYKKIHGIYPTCVHFDRT